MDPLILQLIVALGIGLLIGAERERRKGEGPSRSFAGIRTFTLTALVGAASFLAGGAILLSIATAGVIILTVAAYRRSPADDPGLTTEVAMIATVLLGGLSMQQPGLAAGLGVVVAMLLAMRSALHRFVGTILTDDELQDGLILAGATLVILPLVPDRAMGPYEALNPRDIWILAILIMAISAAGHVAVRLLGPRFGLPLAGLASGFVSSAATIGAMGARAAATPQLLAAAVAAAVLSTVSTVIQMAAVLVATSMAAAGAMAVPLICAGLAAIAYGACFTAIALRQPPDSETPSGRAFSPWTALAFAATLSAILLASAVLRDKFGETGIVVAAALAGFVDTHSAAISVATLVAAGKINAADAVIPILAGLSTNTLSKIVLAATSGGRVFAVRVIPGLIAVALAAWAGSLVLPHWP